MKMKEDQNVVVNIILLSADCVRTSLEANETERIPFITGAPSEANFME